MDREEYREKLDQLTDAVSDRDYTRALNIADEIAEYGSRYLRDEQGI